MGRRTGADGGIQLRDGAKQADQEGSFLFALSVCFLTFVFIVIFLLLFRLSILVIILLLRYRLSIFIIIFIFFLLRFFISILVVILLLRHYIIVISLLTARFRAPRRRIGNGDGVYLLDLTALRRLFQEGKIAVFIADHLISEDKRRPESFQAIASAIDRLPGRGQIARRQRAPDDRLILLQIRRQNPRGGLRSVGELRVADQVVSQQLAVKLIVLSAGQLDESAAFEPRAIGGAQIAQIRSPVIFVERRPRVLSVERRRLFTDRGEGEGLYTRCRERHQHHCLVNQPSLGERFAHQRQILFDIGARRAGKHPGDHVRCNLRNYRRAGEIHRLRHSRRLRVKARIES